MLLQGIGLQGQAQGLQLCVRASVALRLPYFGFACLVVVALFSFMCWGLNLKTNALPLGYIPMPTLLVSKTPTLSIVKKRNLLCGKKKIYICFLHCAIYTVSEPSVGEHGRSF